MERTAAGSASIPVTIMMFAFSTRFGALADRYGPRFFMGVGPLVAAAGLASFLRLDADVNYLTDLLPALLLFGLGLSITVAPLTSTVLADADESNAGIASGVNNAIARVAGLVTIAAVGAVVAASFETRLWTRWVTRRTGPRWPPPSRTAKEQPLSAVEVQGVPEDVQASVREGAEDASVGAFRVGVGISTALVALGGILGLVGIRNPRRRVSAADCPGGQFAGHPTRARGSRPATGTTTRGRRRPRRRAAPSA